MLSPQKIQNRQTSSKDPKKPNLIQEQSPASINSGEGQSKRVREPFVQDTINRLTSPYKKSLDSSTKILGIKQYETVTGNNITNINHNVTTPKKPKSATSSKPTTAEKSRSQRDGTGPFPNQGVVEGDLKIGLTSLKVVVREYEEGQKEKRALQQVVDQLKLQIESLKSRKINFTKNFEKLHKESLLMNDAAASKGNQRKLIEKNIEQVRDDVVNHDKTIQDSISQNVEIANKIKAEQHAVLRVKEKMSELKKHIAAEMKEKEKARCNLKISSKQLKSSQQKHDLLIKEKASYIATIDNSKSLKG